MGSLRRDAQGRVIFEQLENGGEDGEDFLPEWMREREMREASSQSEEVTLRSTGAQARFFEAVACQTSSLQDLLAPREDSQAISSKLVSDMESALRANASSQAFQGYSARWEENSIENLHLYTLSTPAQSDSSSTSSSAAAAAVQSVLSLSWNCRGNLLAVAYGSISLLGTDTRESRVAVWNLSRIFLREGEPDDVILASSSVTSVQFHPRHPGLLLYGTSSGEVSGHDLGRKESFQVRHGSQMHRESISALEWTYDALLGDFHLLSSSLEGAMVLWRLKEGDGVELWPLASFKMEPPEDTNVASLGLVFAHGTQKLKPLGLTCLRVERLTGMEALREGEQEKKGRQETGGFLIGTEVGGVFRCFLNYSKIHMKVKAQLGEDCFRQPSSSFSSSASSSKLQLPKMECPITYSFYPHMGPVHSVAFSPLLRNLFASCAADGIIRVHSSLQAAPLLLLEPSVLSIYCVAWSPMKPLVLAAGGSGGLVFLYDLTVDPSNPVQTMRASPRVARAGGAGGEGWEVESEEREAGSNVNALLFQESGSLLAAGCWSGETHVWRLRNELCEQVPEDGEAAKKLLG